MSNNLIKRKWCYSQSPIVYEIYCDICNGDNITWSEYKGLIWCFDCEKDTRGTGGIFDGPIPIRFSNMMGINFDIIRLEDNELLKMDVDENGKIIYKDKNGIIYPIN